MLLGCSDCMHKLKWLVPTLRTKMQVRQGFKKWPDPDTFQAECRPWSMADVQQHRPLRPCLPGTSLQMIYQSNLSMHDVSCMQKLIAG